MSQEIRKQVFSALLNLELLRISQLNRHADHHLMIIFPSSFEL